MITVGPLNGTPTGASASITNCVRYGKDCGLNASASWRIGVATAYYTNPANGNYIVGESNVTVSAASRVGEKPNYFTWVSAVEAFESPSNYMVFVHTITASRNNGPDGWQPTMEFAIEGDAQVNPGMIQVTPSPELPTVDVPFNIYQYIGFENTDCVDFGQWKPSIRTTTIAR